MKDATMALLLILTMIMWVVWVAGVMTNSTYGEPSMTPKASRSILLAAIFLTFTSIGFALTFGA